MHVTFNLQYCYLTFINYFNLLQICLKCLGNNESVIQSVVLTLHMT